jgi:MFS family permease
MTGTAKPRRVRFERVERGEAGSAPDGRRARRAPSERELAPVDERRIEFEAEAGALGELDRPERPVAPKGERLAGQLGAGSGSGPTRARARSAARPGSAASPGAGPPRRRRAALGQVTGTTMILAAAVGLVVGPIADHYGCRRLFVVGAVSAVASAVRMALTPSYAVLLLASLVGALSRAVIRPVPLTAAGDLFAGDARRRAVALVSAAVAGGTSLGIPILAWAAVGPGWRGAFLALALLAMAAGALAAFVLPADGHAAGGPLRPRLVLSAYRPLLRDGPTLAVMASGFLGRSAHGRWRSTSPSSSSTSTACRSRPLACSSRRWVAERSAGIWPPSGGCAAAAGVRLGAAMLPRCRGRSRSGPP